MDRDSRVAGSRRIARLARLASTLSNPMAQIDTTIQKPAKLRVVMARELHPGAWWIWALGLAAAAAMTLNPWLLLIIVAVAAIVVEYRRTDAPWALSFGFYLWFGLLIVVIRVVFRIIFGGAMGTDDPVLFSLPEIPLPEVARGIQLLGDVTQGAILSGLYDGMRLATIIICVGAANSLANPRQLLASVPPALYEVGTAIVVAMSVFGQLADSVKRVHKARKLRGEPGKGVRAVKRTLIPVLEDALERSLTLAASMDSRGYGRAGDTPKRERWTTGTLMILALIALAIGSYAFLDASVTSYLSWPMMIVGVAFAGLAMRLAGRRVRRTRYRPIRWRAGEWVAVVSGVSVAVGFKLASASHLEVMYPMWDGWPEISLLLVAMVLLGAIPAVLTPPAPRDEDVEEDA